MDFKNAFIAIIGAVVMVVLAVSVLVPVVSDSAQSLEATQEDQANVMNYMSRVDSFEMVQDGTTHLITINGETIEEMPNKKALLISDKMMIRSGVVSTSITPLATMNVWGEGIASDASSNPNHTMTVSLSEGVLTFDDNGTSTTFDITFAFIYDPEGDYVSIQDNYTASVMMNEGDAFALYYNGGWWASAIEGRLLTAAEGTVSTTSQQFAASDSSTGTDVTVSVEFETTSHDGLRAVSCTPSNISAVVPAQYTTYESNASSSLISIVPVLVIVGILTGIIGAVFVRRE